MYRTDKQFMKNPATASQRIYIGALPKTVVAADLEDKFGAHGKILGLSMQTGFAFVQFETEQQAQSAIQAEHGSVLYGKKIIVKQALDKSKGQGNFQQNKGFQQNQGRGPQSRGGVGLLGESPTKPHTQRQQESDNMQVDEPENKDAEAPPNNPEAPDISQEDEQPEEPPAPDIRRDSSSRFEPPPGRHDGPPGRHDGPPGRHDGPPGRHDGPPGRHDGPSGRHDGPPGRHDGPSGRHDGPPGRFDNSSRFEPPSSRFEPPPNRFDGPPGRFDGPGRHDGPMNRGDKSMRDDDMSQRFEEPPSRYDEPPSRYDEPPSRFDDPPSRYDDGPPRFDEPSSRFDDHPPMRGSRFDRGRRKPGRGGRDIRGEGRFPPPPHLDKFSDKPPFFGGRDDQFGPPPFTAPPVVERPERNDCEIIVVSKALTEYAEYIEQRLKSLGLIVDLLFPNEDVPIGRVLANISSRGCLYAILVMPQNEEHRSLTLNLLHGIPQEHRNMPIEDALVLITRNFEAYMRGDPVGPETTSGIARTLSDRHPMSMQMLLNLLAENRQITSLQYEKLIKYLQERRELQVQYEIAEGIDATSQDSSSKQAELQNRILNILNKSSDGSATSAATESQPASNTSAAVTPSPLLKDPTVQKALDSLMLGDMFKTMGTA